MKIVSQECANGASGVFMNRSVEPRDVQQEANTNLVDTHPANRGRDGIIVRVSRR